MTTTIKVHVNGNYRATVTIKRPGVADEVRLVDGDWVGDEVRKKEISVSPNTHPANVTVEVTDEPLTEEMKAAREQAVRDGFAGRL